MIRYEIPLEPKPVERTMPHRNRPRAEFTDAPGGVPNREAERATSGAQEQGNAATEVNITVPSTNAPTAHQEASATLSWSSILSRGLSFGGPAVVILIVGMMIMSPRGQEFMFGVKQVDIQAVVTTVVNDRLSVVESNHKRDLDALRAEIDKERQIAAQERSRDRDVWTLQLQGINKAIEDIRTILRDLQRKR